LAAASNSNRLSEVKELVLKGKANVNCRDDRHRTPLHISAWYGNSGITQFLLGQGADVNSQDLNLRTPLHLAARNGRLWDIQALVGAKADVEMRDSWGKRPGESFDHRLSKRTRERTIQLLISLYGPGLELKVESPRATRERSKDELAQALEDLNTEALTIQCAYRCYEARCTAVAKWVAKMTKDEFATAQSTLQSASGKQTNYYDIDDIAVPEGGKLRITGIAGHSKCLTPKDKEFMVYFVDVMCPGATPTTAWRVYRRYAEFSELANFLETTGATVPPLPKKRFLNNMDPKFIATRQRELENWMVLLYEDNVSKENYFGIGIQAIPRYKKFLTKDPNKPPGRFLNNVSFLTQDPPNKAPESQIMGDFEKAAPDSTVGSGKLTPMRSAQKTLRESRAVSAVTRALEYSHARALSKRLGQEVDTATKLQETVKGGIKKIKVLRNTIDQLYFTQANSPLEKQAKESLDTAENACNTVKEKLMNPKAILKASRGKPMTPSKTPRHMTPTKTPLVDTADKAEDRTPEEKEHLSDPHTKDTGLRPTPVNVDLPAHLPSLAVHSTLDGEVEEALGKVAKAAASVEELQRWANHLEAMRHKAQESLKQLISKCKVLRTAGSNVSMEAEDSVTLVAHDAEEKLYKLQSVIENAKSSDVFQGTLAEAKAIVEEARTNIDRSVEEAASIRFAQELAQIEAKYRIIKQESTRQGLAKLISEEDVLAANEFADKLNKLEKILEPFCELTQELSVEGLQEGEEDKDQYSTITQLPPAEKLAEMKRLYEELQQTFQSSPSEFRTKVEDDIHEAGIAFDFAVSFADSASSDIVHLISLMDKAIAKILGARDKLQELKQPAKLLEKMNGPFILLSRKYNSAPLDIRKPYEDEFEAVKTAVTGVQEIIQSGSVGVDGLRTLIDQRLAEMGDLSAAISALQRKAISQNIEELDAARKLALIKSFDDAMGALESSFNQCSAAQKQNENHRDILAKTLSTVSDSLQMMKAQAEEEGISKEVYSSLWGSFFETEQTIAMAVNLSDSEESNTAGFEHAVLRAQKQVDGISKMMEKVRALMRKEQDQEERAREYQRSELQKCEMELKSLTQVIQHSNLPGEGKVVKDSLRKADKALQKAYQSLKSHNLPTISKLIADALHETGEAKQKFEEERSHQQVVQELIAVVMEELDVCKRGLAVLKRECGVLQGQEPPALENAIQEVTDEFEATERWLERGEPKVTKELVEHQIAELKMKLESAQTELEEASTNFQEYITAKDKISRRFQWQQQRLDRCQRIAHEYIASQEDQAWLSLKKTENAVVKLDNLLNAELNCAPEERLDKLSAQVTVFECALDKAETEVVESAKGVLMLNSKLDGVEQGDEMFETFWEKAGTAEKSISELSSHLLQDENSFMTEYIPLIDQVEHDLKQLASAGRDAKALLESEKQQTEQLSAKLQELNVEEHVSNAKMFLESDEGQSLPSQMQSNLERGVAQTENALQETLAAQEGPSSTHGDALVLLETQLEGMKQAQAEACGHLKREKELHAKLINTLQELSEILAQQKSDGDSQIPSKPSGPEQNTFSPAQERFAKFLEEWERAIAAVEDANPSKSSKRMSLQDLETKVFQAEKLVSSSGDLLEEAVNEHKSAKNSWMQKLLQALCQSQSEMQGMIQQAKSLGYRRPHKPDAESTPFSKFWTSLSDAESKLAAALAMNQDTTTEAFEEAVLATEKATAEATIALGEAVQAHLQQQKWRQKLEAQLMETQQHFLDLKEEAEGVAAESLGATAYSELIQSFSSAGEALVLADKSAQSVSAGQFEITVSSTRAYVAAAEAQLKKAHAEKEEREIAYALEAKQLDELNHKYDQLNKHLQTVSEATRLEVAPRMATAKEAFLEVQLLEESPSRDIEMLRQLLDRALASVKETEEEINMAEAARESRSAQLANLRAEVDEIQECAKHLMDVKCKERFGPSKTPMNLQDLGLNLKERIKELGAIDDEEALKDIDSVKAKVATLHSLLKEADTTFTAQSKAQKELEYQRSLQEKRFQLLSHRLTQCTDRAESIRNVSSAAKIQGTIEEANTVKCSLVKAFEKPPILSSEGASDTTFSEAEEISKYEAMVTIIETEVERALHLQSLLRTHLHDNAPPPLRDSCEDHGKHALVTPRSIDDAGILSQHDFEKDREETCGVQLVVETQIPQDVGTRAQVRAAPVEMGLAQLRSPVSHSLAKNAKRKARDFWKLLLYFLAFLCVTCCVGGYIWYKNQPTNNTPRAPQEPSAPQQQKSVVKKLKNMRKTFGVGRLVKSIVRKGQDGSRSEL